jgi:hypothetical protein
MRSSSNTHTLIVAFFVAAVVTIGGVGCGRSVTSDPGAKVVPVSNGKNVSDTSGTTKKTAPTPKPPEDTGPKLKFTQEEVTLEWIEKGTLKMSATARDGQINQVTRIGQLKGFSAKMYENGKLTTTMSAPNVIADTAKRTVTATGGVVLKSMDRNTTVECEWMTWYAKRQKVIGNGGVRIRVKNKSDVQNMQGAAFIADTALKTLTVMDSAKGLESYK